MNLNFLNLNDKLIIYNYIYIYYNYINPITNEPTISNACVGYINVNADDNNGTNVEHIVIAFSYNIAYKTGSFF